MKPAIKPSIRHVMSTFVALAALQAGAALAAGVTGVTVSPAVGTPDTPFNVTVQGSGNCRVQLFLARLNPDSVPYSLMSNVEAAFPIQTPVKSPWALKPGKYSVEATTLAQDHPGCVLHQKANTTFTVVAPETPQAFDFADVAGRQPGEVVTSAPVTITGNKAAAPVTVTGGSYSINGGAFTNAPGTITAGQSVAVRTTASNMPGAKVTVKLTVGGVVGQFSVTTKLAAPQTPGCKKPNKQGVGKDCDE